MSNESRASMVRSAASLIGSHGLSATSLADVLAASGAPRGSIYHHFPDGKAQLTQEAIDWTSEQVLRYLRSCTAATPAGVIEWFVGMWRRVVSASQATAGCVVAGVAVDTTAEDAQLRGSVRATFRAWSALLAQQLEATGIPPPRAATLALTALATMEGALILCRAEGSVAPLDAVAGELVRLLPPQIATNDAAKDV